MKNLILIALFVFVKQTNAQTYVAIPDSNFVHYLKTIVPTAFKGDSLNTSSPLVTTTTTTMNCSGRSIANLSGIQYFTSLTNLDCQSNSLTTLPTLPNSLIDLDCAYNSLTSLSALPNSLLYLGCQHNSITSLPVLPNSLTTLGCQYNSLTSLPTLPNLFDTLDCSYNHLTSLPTLPNTLTALVCDHNNITCFPTFPNSITSCILSPNSYNCLPNHIAAMDSTDLATPLCAAGNSNGCAVAGIEQVAGINNQVTVYPNPANESLTLTLSQGEGTVNISMYDMLGKLVMQHIYSPPSEGQAIDISNISEGVYNLSVSTSEGIANKRVVIER